jgi:putative flippase GtrA
MMLTTAKYVVFAIVAGSANVLVQWLTLNWLWPRVPAAAPPSVRLLTAMACGTGLSLLIKYGLDRRFIFSAHQVNSETAAFLTYSANGILTTSFFWAVEIIADSATTNEDVKYFAAAIGLAISYVLKYNLDKKLVFRLA